MKTETLFYITTIHGLALRDAKGNHIGWFNTEKELTDWCRENNYNVRKSQ